MTKLQVEAHETGKSHHTNEISLVQGFQKAFKFWKLLIGYSRTTIIYSYHSVCASRNFNISARIFNKGILTQSVKFFQKSAIFYMSMFWILRESYDFSDEFFLINWGISKVFHAKKPCTFQILRSKIFKNFLSVGNCSKKKMKKES